MGPVCSPGVVVVLSGGKWSCLGGVVHGGGVVQGGGVVWGCCPGGSWVLSRGEVVDL